MANLVDSSLFYSNVNKAVQAEILARAEAGFGHRTTAQIDYMVGKVANASIQAYSKSVPSDDSIIPESRLGGISVTGGSFKPNGLDGFLSNPINRTKPYLQDVSITIHDQSRGYLNKATINIVIPDPTTDMDKMEEIFCRPGRSVTLFIEYPESAVLTKNELAVDQNTNYETLISLYPNLRESDLSRLNATTFNGKISNFSYSYETNASVKLTVEMLGTTGTYINVSSHVAASKKSPQTVPAEEQNAINSFYKSIQDDITNLSVEQPNQHSYELVLNVEESRSILNGSIYQQKNNNANVSEDRFITIGQLVYYINELLLTKITNDAGKLPRIICDDRLCQSNYYEKLVSANPKQMLLWPGTGTAECNKYNNLRAYSKVPASSPGFMRGTDEGPRAFPAWIYINMSVIQEIVSTALTKENVTIKDIIMHVSDVVFKLSGEAISLKLIQHPTISDALLLYDTNYIGVNQQPTEFELPIYSEDLRTAVRDVKITSKIPESIKSMIYGLSAGVSTEQQVAMYSEYVYATDDVRKQISDAHKQKHRDALQSLLTAQENYALDLTNPSYLTTLRSAVQKYVTFYTENIEDGVRKVKPVFPLEVSLTLDGINGFKWGDVLNINGIPKKYRDSFVFMVTGVTQAVSSTGEWTTELTLIARVKLV